VTLAMTLSLRPSLAAALATSWLLASTTAGAQSNAAIAEQLFLDGQKLMDAGHLPEACKKFADSQRLDPAIGTLMHLAACHEKAGKVATAWSEFSDVAAQAQKAGQVDREKYAREHAAALDSKLQKVIIELSHPPEGTAIHLDDAALPLGVLGTEIPLDPGDHTLEITAPRMKPWKQAKLNLGPSAVVTRVQVTLEPDPSAQGSATGTQEPNANANATLPGTPPPGEQPATSSHAMTRLIGYGVGGLGIVSLGIAVGEEVTSIGRKNDESKYPDGSPEKQTVADQSSAAQTYALVFGGVGLAAVGVGVYLILTSHDEAPAPSQSGHVVVTPLIGRGLAGAGLRAAW
jgi:hypothetical protein